MNVGTALYPLDDPRIADFMAALDEVNALADTAPGFVWRLQSDQGNATDIKASDDPQFIVNMSVWESAETLFAFVYQSAHRLVMARRRTWFARPDGAYQVLWWTEARGVPTVAQGLARLSHLRDHGPTTHAFTFKERFAPPPVAAPAGDMRPEPYCASWA